MHHYADFTFAKLYDFILNMHILYARINEYTFDVTSVRDVGQ